MLRKGGWEGTKLKAARADFLATCAGLCWCVGLDDGAKHGKTTIGT